MESGSIQITTITGPPFVAVITNWGLFGVLTTQIYLYAQAFPDDGSALKTLVYGVYVLEMAQTCLISQTAWTMFISGFGRPEFMEVVGTTWISVCLIGGSVALLVQLFYVHRTAAISKNKIVAGFIILTSLTSFIGAVVTGIYAEGMGQWSRLLDHKSPAYPVIGLWFAAGAACDVLILVCMRYYVRSCAQNAASGTTRAFVSKIIRLTVETGALTALMSLTSLALFYCPIPTFSGYYQASMAILAKVYSNSMLAIVNSRMKFGTISGSNTTWHDDGHNRCRLPMSPLQFRKTDDIKATNLNNLTSINPPQGVVINIERQEGIVTACIEEYESV